ncbi:MAG: hypothetical protein WCD80_06305 [Desulfobaccales bacterium]
MKSLQIKIAGTVIAAVPDDHCPPLHVAPGHRAFLVDPAEPPQITLNIHFGDLPDLNLGEKAFNAGQYWSLYLLEETWVLAIPVPVLGLEPYRLAVFQRDFTAGDLYARENPWPFDKDAGLSVSPVDPLRFPVEEFLMINYLARWRQGMILHACGLQDAGRGLVFCGVSGAGKSTLAHLWHEAGVTVLSDDRLIVRPNGGGFTIHGTPWHGEAGFALPDSAPLTRLYLIQHASHNYVRPLTAGEAAARLLVRCFPPFYHRDGMTFIVDLLARLVTEVPCCELGFVPDASVIEFVRGLP